MKSSCGLVGVFIQTSVIFAMDLISIHDIIVIVFDRIFTKLVKQIIGVIFNKSGRISTYFRRCQLDDCEIFRVASILRIGSVKLLEMCNMRHILLISTRWHVKFEKLGPLLSSNWHPLMYVLWHIWKLRQKEIQLN